MNLWLFCYAYIILAFLHYIIIAFRLKTSSLYVFLVFGVFNENFVYYFFSLGSVSTVQHNYFVFLLLGLCVFLFIFRSNKIGFLLNLFLLLNLCFYNRYLLTSPQLLQMTRPYKRNSNFHESSESYFCSAL